MIYLIRYGELAIKSPSVRNRFEKNLVRNIRKAVGSDSRIERKPGRIIVESDHDISKDLRSVFGIVNFSPAKVIDIKSVDEIKKSLNLEFEGTFAVRVKRVNFPVSSSNLERDIGQYIVEKTGAKVNLKNPSKTFRIEIRGKKAYIFDDYIDGPGGLPLGTGGRVFVELKNKKDIVAAWLVMRKGSSINCSGDHSLLDKWHKGRKLIDDPAKSRKMIDAMIDSETDPDKVEKKGSLILYPILGMEERDINELYETIRG